MTAVELRSRLNAHTGLSLPPALIFDHPTVNELVELVDERMRESEKDESAGATGFDRIGALIRDCTDSKTRAALRDQLTELIAEVDCPLRKRTSDRAPPRSWTRPTTNSSPSSTTS